MILIAHRGNINGPNPEQENRPEYIRRALDLGFDVEIDVWYRNSKWFLGHDEPKYETSFWFLYKTDGLWIHCKDYITLQRMIQEGRATNFFYHTNEDYVLTSQQFIWAYPGKEGGDKTICVMPEWNNTPIEGVDGICSDYVEDYRK
jgi:hypothetical protein